MTLAFNFRSGESKMPFGRLAALIENHSAK
jgi:hypothetical protein